MRVALTGATGFTGRFVSAALRQIGASVTPLRVDLRDCEAVQHAVDTIEFDCVIHLAGHAFVNASDWQAFYAVNQLGTYNLLQAVAARAPGVRCILSSSAQVYGPGAEGLITEAAVCQPSNHYAVSKRAMELGADLWRDRLEIVITRPFNYTGLGQGDQYLIPKIVRHFQQRLPVIELGNTWVRRDFGDVRSVAAAYAGLAAAPSVPPVVNISTGRVSSITDILHSLSAMSGHAIEVQVNQAFVRKGDVEVLGGAPHQLRKALPSWRPHELDETLEWMYRSTT